MQPQEFGVIFNPKDGCVWASWSDGRPPVNLGDHEFVAEMMSDYVKQSDLAVRLLSKSTELF